MSDTHPLVNIDSQEPPAYYYADLGRSTDGQRFPTRIFVSEEEARDSRRKNGTSIAKRRFKPLASPKRFYIAEARHDDSVGDSLIGLPTDISAYREMWFDDTESFDRPEGLAEVARLNRLPSRQSLCWHLLVELGQPLPMPFGLIEVGQGGMGFAEMRCTHPVCVVRPTADELAQFRVRRPE